MMNRALFAVVAFGPALAACTSTRTPETTPEVIGASQEALASCASFAANADAAISRDEMRRNLGTKKVLRVGDEDETLISFDLSSIPSGAVIDSATLKVYVIDADSERPITIHRATAPWYESTVTFATFAQHA